MDISIDGQAAYVNTGGMTWQDGLPVMCLVHGASLDHSVWMLYSRYFARHGYNVAAPDLPGHGRSAGKPLPTIELMGAWVDRLLEQMNATAVHLAGHSMGSLVALEAAATTPDRYQRLQLLGTAYPMAVGEPLLSAAFDNHPAAIDMVSVYGHAYSSQLGGNPVAGINIMQTAKTLMGMAGPGVMHAGLNACNEYTAGIQSAQRVTAGCSLLLGERDMMTPPRGAGELAEALSARVDILAGCGHMMMAEQPEATLQAMLRAFAPEPESKSSKG